MKLESTTIITPPPSSQQSTPNNQQQQILNIISRPRILADYDTFVRRARLRCFFGPSGEFDKKFYIPNPTWQPPSALPHIEEWLQSIKTSLEHHLENTSRPARLNINHKQERFLNTLRKDKSLIVRPADKNLGLTLMDKCWYDMEVLRQLEDTITYKEVDMKSMPKEIERIYSTFMEMFDEAHKKGVITPEILKYLQKTVTPATTIIPRFYCLPKIHKPILSGRPIVPSHTWITAPASIWLDHILQPLVKEFIYTLIKDTVSLINILESLPLPTNCKFMTADIVSLYTNININHGIACVKLFLNEHSDRIPKSHAILIVKILEFVLKNNYMDYEGRCFLQQVGTAMGTSVAVIFANIFMFILERPIIKKHASKIILYRRFLDDILVILHPDHDDFVNDLTNMNPHIKLEATHSDVSVDFLDIKIVKGNRFYQEDPHIVDIEIHQKALNAYLYIPYISFHRTCSKGAFITTELQRYVRNCSNVNKFIEVRQHFFNRLRERGYPDKFLAYWFKRIRYSSRDRLLRRTPRVEYDIDSNDNYNIDVYFSTEYNAISSRIPMERILKESLPPNSVKPRMSYKRSTNLLGMLISDKKSNVNNVTPDVVTNADNA